MRIFFEMRNILGPITSMDLPVTEKDKWDGFSVYLCSVLSCIS